MRQMVTFTLQSAGFETIEGANGAEALSKHRELCVDLVVTDLNMPIMDGITLVKQLRARPNFKFTPILLLTTESQESKKQEGKAAGATAGWSSRLILINFSRRFRRLFADVSFWEQDPCRLI